MAQFIPAKVNPQNIVGLIESQNQLDFQSVSGNFNGNLTGDVDGTVSGFALETNIDPNRVVTHNLTPSNQSLTIPNGEIWRVWLTGGVTDTDRDKTKLELNNKLIALNEYDYIENYEMYLTGGDIISVNNSNGMSVIVTGYKVKL